MHIRNFRYARYATEGAEYKFLFVAKGGGSANKTMLFQETKALLTPDKLEKTLERVDRLKPLVPAGGSLPDLALRFILHHPAVSTTIPGMRRGHR